ncbi:MAG: hypothetical protein QM756_07855 [Polyangiaceae bacterium]
MSFAEIRSVVGRAASAAGWALCGALAVAGCALQTRADEAGGRSVTTGGASAGVGGASARSGGSDSAGNLGAGAACDSDARCTAEGVLEVCRNGEWTRSEACKGVEYCSAPRRACLSCAPGTFACHGNGQLEQCGVDGATWEVVRPCGSSSACFADGDVGFCSLCEAGGFSCDDSALEYASDTWPASDRARGSSSLRRCNDAGSGTISVSTCAGSTPVCSAPAATCQVCVPNKGVCSGRYLSKCSADGGALVAVAECADATLCDAANVVCGPAGCASGSNKASAVGSVVCEKTTLKVCRESGAWDVLDICESEVSCKASLSARECLDSSAARCTPGSSACDGSVLRRCSSSAGNDQSSLQVGNWYDFAECSAGCRTLSDGSAECIQPTSGAIYAEATLCEPGASSYVNCTAAGCASVACEAGKVCAGSSLGCTPCVPGALRCDGDSLLRCDDSGQRESLERDCSGMYCDKARGRCLPAPVGERYCDEQGRLQTVNADGSSKLVADCRRAALCDVGGCLAPTCVPDSLSCSADDASKVYQCRDGVAKVELNSPCSTSERCVEGLGCALVRRVTAGDAHTCALVTAATADDSAGGYLYCWGANESGQLGNGAGVLGDEAEPRAVLSSLGSTDKLAHAAPIFKSSGLCAGRGFTCADVALPSGGAGVACFGNNERGQLGQVPTTNKAAAASVPTATSVIAFAVTKPAESGSAATPFVGLHAVTCGADFACALDADSRAYCWGANDSGQLGIGQDLALSAPTAVSGLGKLESLLAGERYACAIDSHAQVYCWGDNGKGALGQGVSASKLAKSNLPLRVTGIAASVIGLGQNFAFAVDGEQTVSWGQNQFGQLATQAREAGALPLPATALAALPIQSVVSGPLSLHACALSAGSLWCWGAGPLGEIGDGARLDRAAPALVIDGATLPLLGTPGSLALGKAHSCAITLQGELYCWGANQRHQLGPLVSAAVLSEPQRAY